MVVTRSPAAARTSGTSGTPSTSPGNGIGTPAIYGSNGLTMLGDLSGDTCNVDGISASGWDIDDAASKAVGFAYVDRNGDGVCGGAFDNETVPFVWDARRGFRQLDVDFADAPPWTRAAGISGNGRH